MAAMRYDDSNLQRLFAALTPGQRLKALRGALRREANRVRRIAVNNLRGSIGGDREMERGIRAVVFKRKAGFRVTIGTKRAGKNGKGGKGYYISRRRRGKPGATGKPVLVWAEEGTAARCTKSKTRIFTRSRKGHPTGRMKRYGFMRKTREEVRGSVTDSLHNEIVNSINKTAKKYGCT